MPGEGVWPGGAGGRIVPEGPLLLLLNEPPELLLLLVMPLVPVVEDVATPLLLVMVEPARQGKARFHRAAKDGNPHHRNSTDYGTATQDRVKKEKTFTSAVVVVVSIAPAVVVVVGVASAVIVVVDNASAPIGSGS